MQLINRIEGKINIEETLTHIMITLGIAEEEALKVVNVMTELKEIKESDPHRYLSMQCYLKARGRSYKWK